MFPEFLPTISLRKRDVKPNDFTETLVCNALLISLISPTLLSPKSHNETFSFQMEVIWRKCSREISSLDSSDASSDFSDFSNEDPPPTGS